MGGGSRRETIHLAAEHGIGALAFAFINPEEAVHWINDYYTTLASDCVPIGDAVNPNVACVTTFMCHENEDEAMRRGLEGANFFGYSLAHYYVFGVHRPGETDVWEEYQQHARRARATPRKRSKPRPRRVTAWARRSCSRRASSASAARSAHPIRSATTSSATRKRGVDQVIFCSQSGKNRHEDIMESLELFGKEVLPEFLDRDEKLQQDKARRLEPVIEAAMARKPASDHPPLADRRLRVPRHAATRTADRRTTSSPGLDTAANHRARTEARTRSGPPVP